MKRAKPGSQWRVLADGPKGENVNLGPLSMTKGPASIFDELVVDQWLHVEQMGPREWWMMIGDARVWVEVGRDGRATRVGITRDEYDNEMVPVRGKPWARKRRAR